MRHYFKQANVTGMITWMALLLNVVILKAAYLYHQNWYWGLVVSAPLLVFAGIVKRETSNVKREM